MIYTGIEIGTDGRPLKCPKCNKEQIIGNYCIICGTYLLNTCSGDGKLFENTYNCNNDTILPPNARYCPDCGSTSSYLQQGFLSTWQEEKFENGVDDLPF